MQMPSPEIEVSSETAAETDRVPMAQNCLNIPALISANKDIGARPLMGALYRFEQDLVDARDRARKVLAQDLSPDEFVKDVRKLSKGLIRFGANDLLELSRRCETSMSGMDVLETSALDDLVVWITLAETTHVAVSILFQSSFMFGYAPNGKKLPEPDETAQ